MSVFFKKSLIIGVRKTGKKVKIDLEIKQVIQKTQTINHELITEYKTLSICGDRGQNRKEISDVNNYKELFITESDLKIICEIWDKWHLNDLKPNCIHQTSFNCNSQNYKELALIETKKCPNNYEYGSAWLVEEIPNNVITEIINIFNKYNKVENIEQITNKAIYKNYEIKSSYQGNKKADWSNDNFNNHMIKVLNTETKQKITFEFWNSINSGEITKEYEILNAFYCFASDALAGSQDFDEFCSEFGYDEDSRKVEKIHKKCIKQYNKFCKIFDVDNNDIYDFINELQEVAG